MPRRRSPARLRAPLAHRAAAARAALWALRATAVVHRELKRTPVDEIELPPVPVLPPRAGAGVDAVLRRTRRTCLERALVRQRWLAAQGTSRDLVIGVKSGLPFVAHAWLDGDPPTTSAGFAELSRHPARRH